MKNLLRIIFIVSVAFLLFKLISRISITNLDNQDLTQYVDTRIGSKDNGLESGYTFTGATFPFGMVQFTPSFFSPDRGFVVTQLSGAGCSNMGNFPVSASNGNLEISPNDMTNFNNIDEVRAHDAGRLSTSINGGIDIDLTTSKRAGFAKFKFNNAQKGTIVIGSGVNSTEVSDAYLKITSSTSCEGYAVGGDFCGAPTPYKIYFAVEFDRPSESQKVWKNSNISEIKEAEGKNSGALFVFDTVRDKEINYRIAISYVSVENAKANLYSEDLDFSFQTYLNYNKAQWNDRLSRILIESDNLDRKIQFYTSFYRSLIHPNLVSDSNGDYMGSDFKVHRTENGRNQYSSFSSWDTYRTQAQLLAWLFPDESSDMIQSLVDFAKQSGGYGRWILANIETGIMQGDPTVLTITNSYAFGARDFDLETAYEYMVKGSTIPKLKSQNIEIRPYLEEYNSHGYIEASMLLEYTSTDYAISQYAINALNKDDEAEYFKEKSNKWKALYNPDTNWLNSRNTDGTWKDKKADWREGTYKNYFWMVPYDLKTLIDTIGGKEFAEKRLDTLMSRLDAKYDDDWFASGNEPDFHVPWVYNWTNSPEKTSIIIKRIQDEIYSSTESGLPGNDDLGTMGAWYVFSSIGLYPVIPATPGFSLNLPQFERITIQLPSNKLTIERGSNKSDVIHSLLIDGQNHPSTWLNLEKIKGASLIEYNTDESLDEWKITEGPPGF